MSKSHAGEFLKAALRRRGTTNRAFAASEPPMEESHFSKILGGAKRQIRPETIDTILAKLHEDDRQGFIEAYTLDQLINRKYHELVTGRSVRETSPNYADPIDALAHTLRKKFRTPDQPSIARLVEKVFEAAADSKDLRVALEHLIKFNAKK